MNSTETRQSKGNGTLYITDTDKHLELNSFGFRAVNDVKFTTLEITDDKTGELVINGCKTLLGITLDDTVVTSKVGELCTPAGYTITAIKLKQGEIVLF